MEVFSKHLRYIAPEITNTSASPTVQSDMFSFGMLMYQLMTMTRENTRNPEEHSNHILGDLYDHLTHAEAPLSSINSHVPQAVSDMVAKCLSRSPGNRYVSFDSLRYDMNTMSYRLSNGESLVQFSAGVMDGMARMDWLPDIEDRLEEMVFLDELVHKVAKQGHTELAV